MKRFRWLKGMTGWIVGAVGTGLAVIAAGQEYFGLSLVSSLLILVVVAISVLSLILSAIGNDIDEDIDQLQNDVNDGFERVVDTIDENMDDDVRTDGGEVVQDGSIDEDDQVEPTGNGALGGMVAGGAVGSAFGPGGVLIGGLIGGLLGNEFEYRNLKENVVEKLENRVWNFFRSRSGLSRNEATIVDVRSPSERSGGYWKFRFEDDGGRTHLVRVRADDGDMSYERPE